LHTFSKTYIEIYCNIAYIAIFLGRQFLRFISHLAEVFLETFFYIHSIFQLQNLFLTLKRTT